MTQIVGPDLADDQEGLSSSDVVDRLGGRITYRQLDYWIRVGRVTPSIASADGPGSGRRFSEADVAVLDRILAMLEHHRDEAARLSSGEMWDELHSLLGGAAAS